MDIGNLSYPVDLVNLKSQKVSIASRGDDVDDGHDVRDINLLVSIDIGMGVNSRSGDLVDDRHNIRDIHFLVLVDIPFDGWDLRIVEDFEIVGI